MKAKVPGSFDNCILLVGMLVGPLAVYKTSYTVLAMIILALGGYLILRGMEIGNQGVGMLLRGMGTWVLAIAAGDLVTCIFDNPSLIAVRIIRSAALLWGGVYLLRSLRLIDNLVANTNLTQIPRNLLSVFTVWLVMTSFIEEYTTVIHITFLFACLVYSNLRRCVNCIKELFYSQAGEVYVLPTGITDVHTVKEDIPVMVAGVVVTILSILIPTVSVDLGGVFSMMDKNLFGPSLIFPIIAIAIFRWYVEIDRKVQGCGHETPYKTTGLGSFVVSIVIGVWCCLTVGFGHTHDALVIFIGTLCSLAAFAWIQAPSTRRIQKAVMSVIINTIGALCGISLIGVLILVVSILVMVKFMKYSMHDMMSFGRSIQFTDNHGDFHILNIDTMLDEDGNRWTLK